MTTADITSRPGAALGRSPLPADRQPPHGGFTLIELLIVACIIAILMALVLPLIGTIRRTARSVQCVNQERQMHIALIAFAGEHQGRIPCASNGGPSWSSAVDIATGAPCSTSYLVEQSYLPDGRVFVCPEADQQRSAIKQGFRNVMGLGWAYHYATNICYSGTSRDPADEVMGAYWWGGTHTSRLRATAAGSSKTVLLCDRVMFVSYTDFFGFGGQTNMTAAATHQNGTVGNAAYVDGHVASARLNGVRPTWMGIPEGGVQSATDFLGDVYEGD